MRAEKVELIEQPRIGQEPVWYQYRWVWKGVVRHTEQSSRDPQVLRELMLIELAGLDDRARMLRSVLAQTVPVAEVAG